MSLERFSLLPGSSVASKSHVDDVEVDDDVGRLNLPANEDLQSI